MRKGSFATWVLAAVACAGVAGAPGAAHADSVFALNLLGERIEVSDARSAALGGFVQLTDDSLAVLEYNPAAAAWCKRVTFGVAGYVTRDKNRSADLENINVGTTVSGFAVAFPLYRKRLSFSLGYRGRYDPDGVFTTPETTDSGEPYNSRFERSGGLWAVPFTLALDMGSALKLGGFYSLERGNIQNRWVVDFTGASTADALSTQEREFHGGGWGVGAEVRPLSRVTLGVTYEGAIDYDVYTDEMYTNTTANVSYTEAVHLPERWTGSATVGLTRRFHLYAGASVCDFTRFEGISFPPERLAREEIYALGVEFRRHDNGRWPLRASATLEQLPYTMPEGQNIQRTAFAIGTGLLFKSRKGKLDMTLQFGKTGAVDTNTYQDQFVRFYMSITGAEEWKRRREARY